MLDDLPTDLGDLPLDEQPDVAKSEGWRIEKNSNGYHRWRWQMKDDSGNSITYITTSGKVGYKRGSKYVGQKPEE